MTQAWAEAAIKAGSFDAVAAVLDTFKDQPLLIGPNGACMASGRTNAAGLPEAVLADR